MYLETVHICVLYSSRFYIVLIIIIIISQVKLFHSTGSLMTGLAYSINTFKLLIRNYFKLLDIRYFCVIIMFINWVYRLCLYQLFNYNHNVNCS